jgi:regulator of replication initiation timing
MVEEIECLQVENERLRYLSTSKVKEECPAREDKRHEVYIDPVTGKSSCIRCGKF